MEILDHLSILLTATQGTIMILCSGRKFRKDGGKLHLDVQVFHMFGHHP